MCGDAKTPEKETSAPLSVCLFLTNPKKGRTLKIVCSSVCIPVSGVVRTLEKSLPASATVRQLAPPNANSSIHRTLTHTSCPPTRPPKDPPTQPPTQPPTVTSNPSVIYSHEVLINEEFILPLAEERYILLVHKNNKKNHTINLA